MAKRRWYGSIDNRLEEGRNYTKEPLKEGVDITMYYWSDRTCYYITKVVDQKHIFVHRYEVCADHSKPGGMGHQNWLYFKTIKEERAYINDCIDKGLITGLEKENLDEIIEHNDEEWVFRYNNWYQVFHKDMLGKPLEKPTYYKINEKVSFGVRSYYYDWEF